MPANEKLFENLVRQQWSSNALCIPRSHLSVRTTYKGMSLSISESKASSAGVVQPSFKQRRQWTLIPDRGHAFTGRRRWIQSPSPSRVEDRKISCSVDNGIQEKLLGGAKVSSQCLGKFDKENGTFGREVNSAYSREFDSQRRLVFCH